MLTFVSIATTAEGQMDMLLGAGVNWPLYMKQTEKAEGVRLRHIESQLVLSHLNFYAKGAAFLTPYN